MYSSGEASLASALMDSDDFFKISDKLLFIMKLIATAQ
jgi:hypothetical protein